VRLSFVAHFLKGGHEVIAELRDQSGSARTRIRQAPDAEDVDRIRYLQTMREVASERNTTTFFPLPLDLFAALLCAFSAAELPKG
jgi:hypothetical protein